MGRAACLRFAKEGAKVAAADLQAPVGRETAQMAERAGGRSIFVECDVSKEDDVRKLIRESTKAFGRIDVIYNNAGIFPEKDHSVTDTEEKVWDKVFAVNVKGVAFVCKYGIPEL